MGFIGFMGLTGLIGFNVFIGFKGFNMPIPNHPCPCLPASVFTPAWRRIEESSSSPPAARAQRVGVSKAMTMIR